MLKGHWWEYKSSGYLRVLLSVVAWWSCGCSSGGSCLLSCWAAEAVRSQVGKWQLICSELLFKPKGLSLSKKNKKIPLTASWNQFPQGGASSSGTEWQRMWRWLVPGGKFSTSWHQRWRKDGWIEWLKLLFPVIRPPAFPDWSVLPSKLDYLIPFNSSGGRAPPNTGFNPVILYRNRGLMK